MSRYLERYGMELDAAAARLVAGERPRPGRRPVLLAAAAVAAVVIVMLALSTADAPPEREAVPADTPSWSPELGDDRRGFTTAATDAPPQEQLAMMGVLRREQTAADRGEESLNALRFVDPSMVGVRTVYVRRLESHGVEAVLIPVARFNVDMDDRLPKSMPDRLREAYVEQSDGLCLFFPDPVDGGGLGCFSTENLQVGLGAAGASAPGRRVYYGIVPDAVAKVVIDLKNDAELTVVPNENFYAYSATSGPPYVERTRWFSADGELLIKSPPIQTFGLTPLRELRTA